MSLTEIQLVGLDILKDVHRFCASNSIQYTVFGGTMIGAIRHCGFIPWDDDVDIAMPRPEYEKFVDSFFSDRGYRLFCPENGTSWLPYGRVCDIKRTLAFDINAPWTTESTGVWIDVFPLDGSPDDIEQAQNLLEQLWQKWRILTRYRAAHGLPIWKQKSLYSALRMMYYKISLLCKPGIETLINDYIALCKNVAFGSSSHFANYSYLGYGMREYQVLSEFDNIIKVPFEDTEFCCISGYDKHMKSKYGDYMKMPPIEKRKNHSGYKFYWIDNDGYSE